MDLDDILQKDPADFTDEEIAFLEANVLDMAKSLFLDVQQLGADAGLQGSATLRKLESSVASILINVAAAAVDRDGRKRAT